MHIWGTSLIHLSFPFSHEFCREHTTQLIHIFLNLLPLNRGLLKNSPLFKNEKNYTPRLDQKKNKKNTHTKLQAFSFPHETKYLNVAGQSQMNSFSD